MSLDMPMGDSLLFWLVYIPVRRLFDLLLLNIISTLYNRQFYQVYHFYNKVITGFQYRMKM